MPVFRRLALTAVLAPIYLAGCSTQEIKQFEAKVGAMRCVKDQGHVEGSTEHQACVSTYTAAAERERAETRAAMLGIVDAAAQIRAAEELGRPDAAAKAVRQDSRLVSQLLDSNWNNICRYTDGTKINSGKKPCPASLATGS